MAHPVPWALLCAVVLAALALSAPTILFTQGPFDAVIPLDAGLRWLAGRVPSIDYPSPIGFLYAFLHGAVMWLGGIDARAIWWANIVVAALCLCGLIPVSRNLPSASRFLLLASIPAMLLLPIDVDVFPPDYRYIANYNHWGWGCLAIILTWALQPGLSRMRDDIIAGLAFVALFYLKLTIFIGALPLALLGLAMERRFTDYALPIALIAAGLMAGLWHGLLADYLRDNLAVLRATDAVRAYKLEWQMLAPFNLPLTIALPILWYRLGLRNRAFMTLATAWILLNIIGLQNNYKLIPLIGWPFLLCLPRLPVAFHRWLFGLVAGQTLVLVLVTALGFILQTRIAGNMTALPLGDAGTLGARLMLSSVGGAGEWRGTPQGDSLVDSDGNLHELVNGARQLLADHPGRVVTLEFANVAVLSVPAASPSTYGALWHDLGRSFSSASHESAATLFHQADLVLVPRRYRAANARQLVELYRPWLDACSTVIAENDLWRLRAINRGADPACSDAASLRYRSTP